MATSSIFADFTIRDQKTAEAFVDALDKAAEQPEFKPTHSYRKVTDPDEIRALLDRRQLLSDDK